MVHGEIDAIVVDRVVAKMVGHAEELDALDRAIGDGDHGTNLRRGFAAVRTAWPNGRALPLRAALEVIGRTLVTTVGGASGALYGTLFLTLARELPAVPGRGELAGALERAVAAVAARGRSAPGHKTMLDVLDPLWRLIADRARPLATETVTHCVATAAEATIAMRAVSGRASFLGERSIGHMDPGARSTMLLAIAVCAALTPAGPATR
jgi:dihydroxyacetone kinase-like protein